MAQTSKSHRDRGEYICIRFVTSFLVLYFLRNSANICLLLLREWCKVFIYYSYIVQHVCNIDYAIDCIMYVLWHCKFWVHIFSTRQQQQQHIIKSSTRCITKPRTVHQTSSPKTIPPAAHTKLTMALLELEFTTSILGFIDCTAPQRAVSGANTQTWHKYIYIYMCMLYVVQELGKASCAYFVRGYAGG